MRRPLTISGVLIAAGLVLIMAPGTDSQVRYITVESFWPVVTSMVSGLFLPLYEFNAVEGTVGGGVSLQVSIDLEAGTSGVYLIDADGALEAVLDGPSVYEEIMADNRAEGFFEVDEGGTYWLTVYGGAEPTEAWVFIRGYLEGVAYGYSWVGWMVVASGTGMLVGGTAILALTGTRVIVRYCKSR
ncbi:MAG: hypothetical protein MPI95_03680 [Nitrosopumilus sp.]|nr:hypothetical protein [Nitrosopumilus sp.]MDA7958176.1 hypothetical protein [Nitrosopumilus sp.]